MDFKLSEQEKMVQTMARDFAEKTVLPRAKEIDETEEWPADIQEAMAPLGFYGLPYPEEYGGVGAGYKCYVLALEQLSWASMAVAAIVAINSLAEETLFRYGTEEQKQKFLRPLLEGKYLCFYSFTEAATGSDPRAITTTARPEGDDYIISGEKTFASLTAGAKLGVVYAKDETGRVSCFIVDPSAEGLVIEKPYETLGMRGETTCPLTFNDVRTPKENLLGTKAEGYNMLLETINIGQLGVSAEALGTAQRALELSIDYAKNRIVRGRPMSDLLSIQGMIAEMATRIEAARWMVYRTADIKDEGKSIRKETAMTKLFASQMVVDVTNMAMQIHGSYGYTKELEIERLYRDAKITQIYEVASEIQRVIVAMSLLR